MLSLPYKGATKDYITQTYHNGHKALDMVYYSSLYKYSYGVPLCAPEDVEIIKIAGDVYTPETTEDDKRGFGVWMKGLETGYTHWFLHTQVLLPVNVGDTVRRGQIVAFMGNSGNVYSNGVYVPLEKRRTAPYPGSHLHWELYDKKYKLGGIKRLINPLESIDWTREPVYTNADYLKALAVVVGKAAGLLKK